MICRRGINKHKRRRKLEKGKQKKEQRQVYHGEIRNEKLRIEYKEERRRIYGLRNRKKTRKGRNGKDEEMDTEQERE